MIQREPGSGESISGIGMITWEFDPAIYNPTYPVPLPFLLPLTSVFSLRTFGAPLQKASTRFFSFRLFHNKGPSFGNSSLSITKVKYTLFLL
jgi:hypothetical protein